METWMLIQGGGLIGGLLCVVGAVFAFRGGKKPVAAAALVVGILLAGVGLNATALTSDPVEQELESSEDAPLGDDDFDAPL